MMDARKLRVRTYKIESKETKDSIVKAIIYKFKKNNIIVYILAK